MTTPTSQIPPAPPPPAGPKARTIQRILVETFFVALTGAFAWGLGLELGHEDAGLIVAVIIWIVGDPLLEIIRMMKVEK